MKRFFGMVLLALTCLVAVTAEMQMADPAIGTWKLNVAKSKFSPGPAPQSVTVMIAEGGKVTVDEVDPTGKPVHYSIIPKDGMTVPVEGMDNATLTEKKVDDYHFEHTWKFGEQTMMGKAAIAKSGKTMTYTTDGMTPEGKPFHNVELFEKQ